MKKTREIKQDIEFNLDLLYQKGYDLGFRTLLEDLDQIADAWWNAGFTSPAEMLRIEIKKLRSEN
jgi:hypothetical protein